ncbi:NADH dehydrogenase [ubiquinone] 1 alpha subcomplex subunit 5-like [Dama dama]|uniref:NADH dehydrogenase [ubiquinone] 1 alpha subcomplex subunit 5-like n=1 Tax=Dama dama TaxID=30532 RepID=UPI002A369C3D|nr:NADH dehydrogenase [ubiquinone] 1 alpha subcomplex subunit 5-like [Dama dama]
MAGLLKTTDLVGLAVCKTPYERLKIFPVKAEPDVKNLGEQLQGGQIEKVILQAEKELRLTRKLVQWKPWDPLVKEPPANQWKWPV